MKADIDDENEWSFRDHLKRHKVVYTAGVSLAVITCLIVRGRHAGLIDRTQRGLQDHRVHAFSFNFLSKDSGHINNIVSTVEREGRGHPGYITRWIDEMVDYETQGLAALAHEIEPTIMSLHIRGKIPDIDEKHFERVGIAA